MTAGGSRVAPPTGGVEAPPEDQPSTQSLRWLLGLRLVVISTLLVGALIIQVTTRTILPLRSLYSLCLLTYGLSLGYLVLYARGASPKLQVIVQLVGDIGVVTGFVYVTGGLYSPFSFLYLIVIVTAAGLLRGGGLVFAGLSAVAYGVLVDLMVFRLMPLPQSLMGERVTLPSSRILYQLLIHVVGFILVAVLVSYLSESLRKAHHSLESEKARARQFAALTDHVVRSVEAGILAVDTAGSVLHINPAGARILGIEEAEGVVGKHLSDVAPLAETDWGLVLSRARARTSTRVEAVLASTGTPLGLTLSHLVDESGQRVGFVLNYRNLTEAERKAERRRVQERMAAMGEMAARLAHEIKNPLASISGSAQVLAGMSGDETAARLQRILVDESQRLSRILDEFLDYGRQRQTTLKPCDLVSLLRDCLSLLRRSEQVRPDHTIQLEAPNRVMTLGDENLLRQVFWNLSLNAVQAMPEGGRLEIEVERRGPSVLLRWRDQGVGMDEAARQVAFEPFVSSHRGGTGLGLAVVFTAVEEHGGSVDIDSSPGNGTTVSVMLPLLEEPT